MTEPLIISPDTHKYPVTWIDGRILFKLNKKWANFYYGICHCAKNVFAITPVDYLEATMIITIHAGEISVYCDRAKTCLNLTCFRNRLDKTEYIKEFKDCGAFTLGLPNNFSEKKFWFNIHPYDKMWPDMMIQEGGILRFNEYKR